MYTVWMVVARHFITVCVSMEDDNLSPGALFFYR